MGAGAEAEEAEAAEAAREAEEAEEAEAEGPSGALAGPLHGPEAHTAPRTECRPTHGLLGAVRRWPSSGEIMGRSLTG